MIERLELHESYEFGLEIALLLLCSTQMPFDVLLAAQNESVVLVGPL